MQICWNKCNYSVTLPPLLKGWATFTMVPIRYITKKVWIMVVIMVVVMVVSLTLNRHKAADDVFANLLPQQEPEPQRVVIQEGNGPEVARPNDANLEYLVETLSQRMKDAKETPDFLMSHSSSLSFKSCSEAAINYNDSCDPTAERCLRRDIAHDPRQRILDFVYSDNSFLPHKFRMVMERMRQRLTMEEGKDTIIVSACSSNHYTETQAQIKNMQETIIPVMPNIKYVIYDLGLKPGERIDLEKYGKATVLDFPFDELPKFFSKLKCFSWKVFIIAAHLNQAEILIWGDASTRFKDPVDVQELIYRAKNRGIQQRCDEDMVPNPVHTDPILFEMWGDSPCAHLPYRMCAGNFGVYHNEPFVHQAIMTPWAACAAKEDCMCKDDALVDKVQVCSGYRADTYWLFGLVPINKHMPYNLIGTCHRFDQSMISVILAKLFREKYYHFAVDTNFAQKILREHRVNYFDELKHNN